MAEILLNPYSIDDYRALLRVKQLPTYRIQGHVAIFPDEYLELVTGTKPALRHAGYDPIDGMFDYQSDITKLAIRKQKFAVFAECGLGKTLIMLEFARHAEVVLPKGKRILIVSPLMVIDQTIAEAKRFYGERLQLEQVTAANLSLWLHGRGGIGITNYEAIRDELTAGNLGSLILDESSMLKSHYGKWATKLIELGQGLQFKLCLTGTPAPNDRIEYANHAVFLDQFPTVNSFLATFFVNRGQTGERWELRPHALGPFYLALSHWCIFLNNPATYGWSDNVASIPPIHTTIHDVNLTDEQVRLAYRQTGDLFANRVGGIAGRAALGSLAKGRYRGKDVATLKPQFIIDLVSQWPDESTIIWCKYNHEQEALAEMMPEAANITGTTKHAERMRLIHEFIEGRTRVLITKPKILGFGLNLQIATRHVFSGLHDSYEEFHQAVKRSNRIGSTLPLRVHIPVTDIERPMVDNVLRKASLIDRDTQTQERLFKQYGMGVIHG